MDNVVQVVSGWLFSPDQQSILLVNNIGGSWSPPGGAVEAGEWIQEAMVREVHEETGLHISPKRLIALSEGFSAKNQKKIVFFGFLVEQTNPTQQPSIIRPEEISDFAWVNRENIKDYLPWLQFCPWRVVKECNPPEFYKSSIL